jgi:tetratricopeptide (TPR) repeat protein
VNSKDRSTLIRKIEKYYKDNEGKSLYFYPLALLYLQNNEKEKAYQVLIDGIQYFPRYSLALVKIAEILINEQKYKASLAYLETALEIQKNNSQALKYLALVYENLKDYEKAIKTYEKILEMEPANETVKSKIIELAPFVKPKTDNIEELMDVFEEDKPEAEKEPENHDILENVEDIKIDAKEGSSEDSKTDSKITIDTIPHLDLESDNDTDEERQQEDQESEEASITLAKLYEKQGYMEDAVKIYKRVLEQEPDNTEAMEAITRLQNLEAKDEI